MANLFVNDGGDARLEDEDGNVVARYDETANEWVFNNTDVQGVGGFDAQSVRTENVNNEVYASEYAGADLKEKVVNAANALAGGQGRIRVTAKDDGTNWEWGSTWTVDPTAYEGIELDIDATVAINDSTAGFAISIEPPTVGDQLDGQTFSLYGGRWFATNADPDGWLRGQDVYKAKIYPTNVQEYKSSTKTSVAIAAEIVDEFSEGWHVGGKYNEIDVGLDFRPASVTGGSGGDSFDDWVLDKPTFDQVKEVGVRARGGCRYHHWNKPAVLPGSDDAVAYRFDGNLGGTTLTSPKADEVGAVTGTVGVETGSNYSDTPVLVSPRFAVDTDVVRADTQHQIPVVQQATQAPANGATQFGDYGRGVAVIDRTGSLSLFNDSGTRVFQTDSAGNLINGLGVFATGQAQNFQDGFRPDGDGSVDLSTVSAGPNEVRVSNGTNLTAGPAWWDGATWHSLVDSTTYTP